MPYGDKKSYSFFKMKYQGNPSAFPFKSPLKQSGHIEFVGDLLKKEKSKKKTKHVTSPSIFGHDVSKVKSLYKSAKKSDFAKGLKQGIKNIKKIIKE